MSEWSQAWVDVHIDESDRHALAAAMVDPRRSDLRQLFWFLRALLWTVLLLASILHPIVWIAVALEAVLLVVQFRGSRVAQHSRAFDALNGRYTVEVEGLRRTAALGETVIFWPAVEALSQTPTHLVVRFSGTGWVFPARCFESADHREHFTTAIAARLNGRI